MQKSLAIKRFQFFGPTFGDSELIAGNGYSGLDRCISVAYKAGFMIGINFEGNNKLTNLKCEDNLLGQISKFTISELEEWEIIFEE